MVRCRNCGRELTDPVSINRGIGPECMMESKRDQIGQLSMFSARAAYDYSIDGPVLRIRDLGGGKSVTNDIETILSEIEYSEGDLSLYAIMYRDGEGMWDQVSWSGGRAEFLLIQESDYEKAKKKLKARWHS